MCNFYFILIHLFIINFTIFIFNYLKRFMYSISTIFLNIYSKLIYLIFYICILFIDFNQLKMKLLFKFNKTHKNIIFSQERKQQNYLLPSNL